MSHHTDWGRFRIRVYAELDINTYPEPSPLRAALSSRPALNGGHDFRRPEPSLEQGLLCGRAEGEDLARPRRLRGWLWRDRRRRLGLGLGQGGRRRLSCGGARLALGLLRLALGLLRLAGGNLFETFGRHRARVVLNGLFALRPVEVNPYRVNQNRPAIGLAQHPGAQHALGVGMTPPESFRDRGRGVRQRTDLVSLDRKRLRPPGAKKLDLLGVTTRAVPRFTLGWTNHEQHSFGRWCSCFPSSLRQAAAMKFSLATRSGRKVPLGWGSCIQS